MDTQRRRLPNRRGSETFTFECAGFRYTATISRFDDGSIGEIFISNCKCGSTADTNARDSAIICSIAMQHGVPIEAMRSALLRDGRGQPSGPLGVALDMLAAETEGDQ
jgi:hypothetical protein